MFGSDREQAEMLYDAAKRWAEEFLGRAAFAGLVVEGRGARASRSSAPRTALQLGYIVVTAAVTMRKGRRDRSLARLREGYLAVALGEEVLTQFELLPRPSMLAARAGVPAWAVLDDPVAAAARAARERAQEGALMMAVAHEMAGPMVKRRVEEADGVASALAARLLGGEPSSRAWTELSGQLHPVFAASLEDAADEARFGPILPGMIDAAVLEVRK